MDRFAWIDGALDRDEQVKLTFDVVKIYDGDDKNATFDNGRAEITTHRLIWRHNSDQRCIISLPLASVTTLQEVPGGFYKSAKIAIFLQRTADDCKLPGPAAQCRHDFIRLSFKDGANPPQFLACMNESLSVRAWQSPACAVSPPKQKQVGIIGIEKKVELQGRQTGQTIAQSFRDLQELMDRAKPMVDLAQKISQKIREKQGEISDDETTQFKAYLLSLGIDDPVTRESHQGSEYFNGLARQASQFIEPQLEEAGGSMTLTDVYCRLNRARGLELVSPEDLLKACCAMLPLALPVRLRTFPSGVKVLQLESFDEEKVLLETRQVIEQRKCLTAEGLARLIGISVVLSKERLLLAESCGMVCRDESVEGLRFFNNKFLNEEVVS